MNMKCTYFLAPGADKRTMQQLKKYEIQEDIRRIWMAGGGHSDNELCNEHK